MPTLFAGRGESKFFGSDTLWIDLDAQEPKESEELFAEDMEKHALQNTTLGKYAALDPTLRSVVAREGVKIFVFFFFLSQLIASQF